MPAIQAPSSPPKNRPPFEVDLKVLGEGLFGQMLPLLTEIAQPAIDYDVLAEKVKEKILPGLSREQHPTPVAPSLDLDLLSVKVGERILPDLTEALAKLLSHRDEPAASTGPTTHLLQAAGRENPAFTRQPSSRASSLQGEESMDVSMNGEFSESWFATGTCCLFVSHLSAHEGSSTSSAILSQALRDDAAMPPPSSEEDASQSQRHGQGELRPGFSTRLPLAYSDPIVVTTASRKPYRRQSEKTCQCCGSFTFQSY